jgi:putative ABC transport system substrate-binding protein
VQSLARPAGSITGVTVDVGFGQWDKRIEFLRQAVPQLTRLWVLEQRAIREQWEAQAREGSRRSKITLVGPPLDPPIDEAEYRRVFAVAVQDHADGIMVSDASENTANRKSIVELAEKSQLPAVYPYKVFVESGG